MKSALRLAASAAFLAALPAAGLAPPALAADIQAGRQVYQSTCSACHGTKGKGMLPRMPDLRQPGGVLSQPDSVLLHRIERGYKSAGSPIAMPPKGGNGSLTEQQLKDVLAYMHQTFGVPSRSASVAPPLRGQEEAASGPGWSGAMGPAMDGGRMPVR
jgi:mono/diheme cytochrome c family protein